MLDYVSGNNVYKIPKGLFKLYFKHEILLVLRLTTTCLPYSCCTIQNGVVRGLIVQSNTRYVYYEVIFKPIVVWYNKNKEDKDTLVPDEHEHLLALVIV